jgi:group I intron endonuclease
MGYIYSIRNKVSGKRYVGQTGETDPSTRWKAHLNCIRRGVGCPALRDAFQKYGEAMFEFQVLIICFDEDRFELEKEYIKKYNTIVPNGYNIVEGGIGGAGFRGKTHSKETMEKIRINSKKMWENVEYRKAHSKIAIEYMKKVKDSGVDWGEKVKTSPKWISAKKEGRVGPSCWVNKEETKKKISESLKKHFSINECNNVSIEKHRIAMAKASGTEIAKVEDDGAIIETYPSIAEASRRNNINKGTLRAALKFSHRKAGGFKWIRMTENDGVITHVA